MNSILIGSGNTWASTPAVPRRHGISRATLVAAVMCVLVITASIVPLGESWTLSTTENYQHIDSLEDYASEGSLARKLTVGSLGLVGLLGILLPGRRLGRVDYKLAALCLGYVAWCGISCTWADDSGIAFRRFVALVCEALAAAAIVKHVPLRQFVWMALVCSLAWLGLGLLAELSLGTFRPWQSGYRFAGVFHPNRMSINCGILLMASVYLARNTPSAAGRRWLWTLAVVAFAFLYLTASRTAVIAAVASLGAAWLMTASARHVATSLMAAIWVGVFGVIVAGSVLVDTGADMLTMGRTDSELGSLTGRLPLWEELLYYVSGRPLTGYGYNSFWGVDHIRDIAESQDWNPVVAHSAYIDLLLSIGIVGFALCLLPMLIATIRANRRELLLPGRGYGFITLLMLLSLIGGLTETTLGITWLLSLFGLCGVAYLVFEEDELARMRRVREPLGPPRLKPIHRHSTGDSE